jgi:hypothetical protein
MHNDRMETAPRKLIRRTSTGCSGGFAGEGALHGRFVISVFSEIFIGVAIQPALARLRRRDDGMPSYLRVLRGVTIRGVVTTMSTSAFLARAQVDPVTTDLYAFVALIPLRRLDRGNRAEVSAASFCHEPLNCETADAEAVAKIRS